MGPCWHDLFLYTTRPSRFPLIDGLAQISLFSSLYKYESYPVCVCAYVYRDLHNNSRLHWIFIQLIIRMALFFYIFFFCLGGGERARGLSFHKSSVFFRRFLFAFVAERDGHFLFLNRSADDDKAKTLWPTSSSEWQEKIFILLATLSLSFWYNWFFIGSIISFFQGFLLLYCLLRFTRKTRSVLTISESLRQ